MNPFAEWGITFAAPWLLLLLLLIPILAWIKGARGPVPAVMFSSVQPLRTLGRAVESRAGNFLTSLLFLALALLIVALARPQLGKTLSHVQASGIDIMLVLDVSGSMRAEDFTIGGRRTNRLEAVKRVVTDFINNRPNDRIGIVAFAGRPYLVSPLTLDHDWLLKNLERVRIGLVEDGTAIGSALASGANRIKERESKSKVLILLSDGESNAGRVSPETAAEAVKALGIKLYAIGAGTKGTAPMPVMDRHGNHLQDMFGRPAYQDARVDFNEEGLRKVAEIAEGQFYRATDTRSLEEIYRRIDQLEKSTVELQQYKQYRDLFPWFLGVGAALLSLEVVLAQTLWRKLP